MGMKEAYQEKLEAQLRIWNAKIEELKGKADKAEAEAKIRYQEQLQALRAKQEEAEKRLRELKAAGEGAWEDLKGGIEKVWDELRDAVEKAASRFK